MLEIRWIREFEFSKKFRSKFSHREFREISFFYSFLISNPISSRIKRDFDPFQLLLFHEIKLRGMSTSSNISVASGSSLKIPRILPPRES